MTEQQTDQETKRITCNACEAEHDLQDMVKMDEVRPNVVEVYLLCPDCGDRLHSHYETEVIKAERVKVRRAVELYQKDKSTRTWDRYKAAQQVFQRKFDKEQTRWRRKLGTEKREKEGENGTA